MPNISPSDALWRSALLALLPGHVAYYQQVVLPLIESFVITGADAFSSIMRSKQVLHRQVAPWVLGREMPPL